MPVGDLAPELAVLGTAVLVVLAAAFLPHRKHGTLSLVALTGLGTSAWLSVGQLTAPAGLTFHGTWAMDEATVFARVLILLVTAVAVCLSPGWMRTDRRHGEYYGVLLLSALGAILLAGASDTLELVVAVLLSSVTGYTLAGYHRSWGLSVEAGMKYFLVGAFANVVLGIGVVLLYGLVGDTAYAATRDRLAEGADPLVLLPAVALLVVGLTFKLGAFPAHAWMPDVAEGSPAPAAAFLTVAPKIGAAVALVRFLELLPADLVPWRALLAFLAVTTMTLGNLAALWQDDVRRLLGWSSVSQSGYALMAVVVWGRSDHAWPALWFFLFGYALAQLAAFAVVIHLRGRTLIEDYAGLSRERPLQTAVLALSFLSLVGVPPLVGFVGKLELFTATLDGGFGWLAVVAVANTVVSLFYYLRVLGTAYFDEPSDQVATLDPWTRTTSLATGLAVVVGGLAAGAILARLSAVVLLP